MIRASLRIPPRPRTLRDHKKAIEWSDGKVPLRVRSSGPTKRGREGGTEEGKLFVHFAPAWRMCRAIRRMLRGVGFNFITVKQTLARAIIQSLIKPDLQAPACRFTKPIQVPKIQWSTITRQGGDSHERWHLSSGPPPTGRADVSALANRTCFGHEPQTRASAVPTKKETPLVLGDRGKSG